MSRLERLQDLLERVQKNATEPRVVASTAPADDDLLDLDEPLEAEAAQQPPVEPIEDLDDIEDIQEVSGDDIDIEDEDEPPESGVGRGAGAVDRAMEAASNQPPMTPPPESGEEPAPRVQPPKHEGPTMEQLGQTISLDEGPDAELQLDEPAAGEVPKSSEQASKLEADLPRGGGAFDEKLQAPPEAREELDRVHLGETKDLKADVIPRPVLSTNVVELVRSYEQFEPETFVQLLDSSLSL